MRKKLLGIGIVINTILSVIAVGAVAVGYSMYTEINEVIIKERELYYTKVDMNYKGMKVPIKVSEKDSVEKVRDNIKTIFNVEDHTALEVAKKIVRFVNAGATYMALEL